MVSPPWRLRAMGRRRAIRLLSRPVRCGLLVVLLAQLPGCDRDEPASHVREPALQVRTINGHAVPVFPSPDEQLAYTRSSFARQDEKLAALEAVARFFPDAEAQRGEAALELAYQRLGSDYRQASAADARAALAAYEAILLTHGELPAIAVKAQWYRGWIHCTLLGDRERGLAAFRTLVERFPQTARTTGPSAPLVSLTPSAEKSDPLAGGEEPILWADLALLAMVRCADGEKTAREALVRLWQRDPHGRCTGLALRELLRLTPPLDEAVDRARDYLAGNSAHVAIASDLRDLLAGMTPTNQVRQR